MKVFLCEPLHADALALLCTRAEVVADKSRLAEVDAVINRNLHMDEAFFAASPRLRVVGIHGVGTDGVDLAAAARQGVRVVNVPGENTVSVAELIVGLALTLERKIYVADRALRAGEAVPSGAARLCGHELHGKTLGLVGTGDIAMRAARMMQAAFAMQVVGYAPSLTKEKAASLGITRADSVEDVLRSADVINIGVPLTPATRGMIGAAQLCAVRPGAVLINTARGGVVQEDALLQALQNGSLAAAACDVFAQEPPTVANPLLALPNFVATPHIGATTEEALRRVGMSVVQQIFDVLDGKTPTHEVHA